MSAPWRSEKQAASVLHLHRSTLAHWRKQGWLAPGVLVGVQPREDGGVPPIGYDVARVEAAKRGDLSAMLNEAGLKAVRRANPYREGSKP